MLDLIILAGKACACLTFNLMIGSLFALSGINKIEKRLTLGKAGNELAQSSFFVGESNICEFLEETFDIGIRADDDLPMNSALVLLDGTFDIVKQTISCFAPASGTLVDETIFELFHISFGWIHSMIDLGFTRYPSPSIKQRRKPFVV